MDIRAIVRQTEGHEEIALGVHSASASIVTVFLATRLWARQTYYGGLWRDDYIRKFPTRSKMPTQTFLKTRPLTATPQ